MLKLDSGTKFYITKEGAASGWFKHDMKEGESLGPLVIIRNRFPLSLFDRSLMAVNKNMFPLYFKSIRQFNRYVGGPSVIRNYKKEKGGK